MVVRSDGNLLEVQAPAKLNLHLEILSRRSDGFHEIETLMLKVPLYDTLSFASRNDPELNLSCQWAAGLHARAAASLGDLPAGSDNIVQRALVLLQQESGTALGADVRLVKRIPSQAGLGGASSDAAAALLAANVGWKLNWSNQQLAELAGRLGSDVPFFLCDGAAVCRGRGEQIEVLGHTPPLFVVIVRPDTGLSTPAVFRACRVATRPVEVAPLLAALQRGDATTVGRSLMNRLQEPAEQLSPAVVELRQAFAGTDCLGHQMSGSGSSYFGICRSAAHARSVAARLRAADLGLVAWGAAGAA